MTSAGDNRVRVGLFPLNVMEAGAAKAAESLAAIAESGLDHVCCGDHVSFFTAAGFDGLVQATALAMLHPTLPIHTGVYLLPLRHPTPVARQLADIDRLAPGRLTLGVGIGGEDRHEVEVCGVDPRTRGRRMDECLEVLRGLMTAEPLTYRGRFYDLDEALVLPAPSPPIPLVVGGRSEAAVRRAARLGDGWLAIWVSPRRFADALGQIEEEAAAADRDHTRFQHALNVWCGFGDR